MRVPLLFLSVAFAVLAATNARQQRIIGGEVTTIDRYPFQAALLVSIDLIWYTQSCGGTILNQRSVLSAAHCFLWYTNPANHRVRVGSTFANSGGVVHTVSQLINHPFYNILTQDNDIAVVRLASLITFNNFAQPGSIAGANYQAENQVVWAIGWGLTSDGGQPSEQLRHVQIWTIDQEICRQRYGNRLTDNMLCSGWLDVGGRDQCSQDSGGPLIHNGVVVGVCSWGTRCADPWYPGVNARVSRYTSWIQVNA